MATPLTPTEIQSALSTLPGWQHHEDKIHKQYTFPSYLEGMAFATAVGVVAEGLGHHPDLLIGWRRVTVSFNTHDAGSKVTAKDIEAAQTIEALPYKPASG
jgi:4a-hydroxytetrahydrobiopterin dehydratase